MKTYYKPLYTVFPKLTLIFIFNNSEIEEKYEQSALYGGVQNIYMGMIYKQRMRNNISYNDRVIYAMNLNILIHLHNDT